MHGMTRMGAAALALSTVLVGGALVLASPDKTVDIAASDNTFSVTEINAAPGEDLTVQFVNLSILRQHSIQFDLGGGQLVGIDPVGIAIPKSVEFKAPTEPGTYDYYCTVGNHRMLGMTGTLIVGSPGQAARVVPVEGSNFKYVPDTIGAAPGEALDVQFKNVQGTHDIVFDLDGGRQEKTARIQAGATADLTFNAPVAPGSYDYYCSVGMHRANGMFGKLVVTAPPQRRKVTITGTNFKFDPSSVSVQPSEPLTIELKNDMGFHDIVFELDGGRKEQTGRFMAPGTQSIAFDAPAAPGSYDYYCSVGMHRANGMFGTLVVEGAGPTAPPGSPSPPTPTPTAVPTTMAVSPVVRDLKNPHGLWLQNVTFQGVAQDALVVSEGGTGTAKPGGPAPGNGDGRVQVIGLDNPALQLTVVDGRTNSVDPGGRIIGANHAIPWPLDPNTPPTSLNLLIAQSGGQGQLRPAEAAKILKVGLILSTPTVLADTLAYETANNPDGADPTQGGIDSDPAHLVPSPAGDAVLIVDSGANDILKLNPTTGALSTWAILEPYENGAQPATPTGLAFSPVDPFTAYVSLRGGRQAPSGRILRLSDVNKDGDVLDENETHELVTGLSQPMALAYSPGGRLYVAELGTRRISYVPELSPTGGTVQVVPVVKEISAVTAMAFEPTGSLLVTYDIDGPSAGAASQNPDTIGRIAAGALEPSGIPTAVPTTPVPTTPVPTTPRPTTTPTGGKIFLPVGLKAVALGG